MLFTIQLSTMPQKTEGYINIDMLLGRKKGVPTQMLTNQTYQQMKRPSSSAKLQEENTY